MISPPPLLSMAVGGTAPWINSFFIQEVIKTKEGGWAFPTYTVDPREKLVEVGKDLLKSSGKYTDDSAFDVVLGKYTPAKEIAKSELFTRSSIKNPFAPLVTEQNEMVGLIEKLTKHYDGNLNPSRTKLLLMKNFSIEGTERHLYDNIALDIFKEAGIAHKIVGSYMLNGLFMGLTFSIAPHGLSFLYNRLFGSNPSFDVTPTDLFKIFSNIGIDSFSCAVTSGLYTAGILAFSVSPGGLATIAIEGSLGIAVNVGMRFLADKLYF